MENNEIISFNVPPYYVVNYNKETGVCEICSLFNPLKIRYLKQHLNSNGYLCVKLHNKSQTIHGLIGKYFFGKKKGYSINHIDGDKLNNSLKNLEYITIAENIQHAIRTGLHVCCISENMPTYKDGRAIRSRIKEYKHEWYEEKKLKNINNTKNEIQ